MKLSLVIVGKTDFPFIEEGLKLYTKRINRYTAFDVGIVKSCKDEGKDINVIKIKEGKRILDLIKHTDYLILLDDKGKEFNSIQFSTYIETKMASSIKQVVFLIGGAYGFSEEVYNRANDKISLSKMTFSHQLVRLVFVEQLYRAFTILKNEPYHHE